MILFPITDIIPHICMELEVEDIYALTVINHATTAQLRALTVTNHRTFTEYECIFDIVERITAGIIIHTRMMGCATYGETSYIMRDLIYLGAEYTGPIYIDEINVQSGDAVAEYIVYAKNNVVKNCAMLEGYKDDMMVQIFKHAPLHYAKYIATLFHSMHCETYWTTEDFGFSFNSDAELAVYDGLENKSVTHLDTNTIILNALTWADQFH